MKKVVYLLLFILFSVKTNAQEIATTKIAALEKQFQNAPKFENAQLLFEEYLNTGKNIKAKKIVDDLFIKTKNKGEKATLHVLYGKFYKIEGKLDVSLYHFLQAKKKLNGSKDYLRILHYAIEWLEYNRRVGNTIEGEKVFYTYLHLAQKNKIKDPKVYNRLYNRFAAILNESNRGHISINYSFLAIEYAKKMNDKDAEATSYNEIGFSYKNKNQFYTSLGYYEKAKNTWLKIGYNSEAVNAWMNYLDIIAHNNLEPPVKRLPNYYKVLDFVDKNNVDFPRSRILSNIELHLIWLEKWKETYYASRKTGEAINIENQKANAVAVENVKEQFQNDQLKVEANQAKKLTKIEKEKFQTSQVQLWITIGFSLLLIILAVTLYRLWLRLRKNNKLLIIRNEQKTMLVQEIHHRVKNNLQFVHSILKMQQGLTDVNAYDSIEDVTRRIDAMSLVHEMLYIGEDQMNVSVKDYILRLLEISNSFYASNKRLKFIVEVEEMELPLEKLIAIGIICSELLTNSVKHAFTHIETPEFSVKLSKIGNEYELMVKDNGQEIDLVKDIDRKKLGLRLIDIFSRQLGGEGVIHQGAGYSFCLKF